jgi:hypothetical protein
MIKQNVCPPFGKMTYSKQFKQFFISKLLQSIRWPFLHCLFAYKNILLDTIILNCEFCHRQKDFYCFSLNNSSSFSRFLCQKGCCSNLKSKAKWTSKQHSEDIHTIYILKVVNIDTFLCQKLILHCSDLLLSLQVIFECQKRPF